MKPLTNRPPRTSPRSSSRRNVDEQIAPRRQVRLAREQLAEDDAVAGEQHPAGGLERPLARHCGRRVEAGPAAGAVARPRVPARALARAAPRVDQRAQVVEAVGRDETGGDQLPERRFDFGFEPAGASHDVRGRTTRRRDAGDRARPPPRGSVRVASPRRDAAASSRCRRARRT